MGTQLSLNLNESDLGHFLRNERNGHFQILNGSPVTFRAWKAEATELKSAPLIKES